jgi:nucleotide-binding universal stress UspA family protein
MAITKILLPHDGTEMSDIALDKAKEFARAFNAEISLLHVIEDIPISATLILDNERTWIAQTKRSIAKKLEEGWMKMAQEKIISNLAKENIKAAAKVLIGSDSSPAEQIVRFAKDNQVDMIITGSQRLDHISSKIKALGSVARRVSEAAECPVLIVH